ncbi:MAG: GNAT family N-acetyltransferase [Acidobacteria bacterium]|nr:GNAT family N-acetyltransferase [Acidobacteriota bacterium]
MDQLHKTAILKDGSHITMRPLARQDGPALLAFFRAMPKDDRLFLREDLSKKEVMDRLIEGLDYEKSLPLIAIVKSTIVGYATIQFNKYGWQRHMAEIRCVISRKYQHKSLATILLSELVSYADRKGILMISAKMMDSQKSAQRILHKLGFIKEAELENFVIDINGKTHNLIVMVNNVSELWKKMEDLLIDSDVKTY